MPLHLLEILETTSVVFLACASAFSGWWFMRKCRGRRWWWAGYAVPFAVVLCIDVPRWFDGAGVQAAFGWFVKGRVEFALMAFAVPMLVAVCIDRLKTRGQKIAVGVFGLVATVNFGVFPFFLPLVAYGELVGIESRFDAHGVCLQSTGYNCGPAAAVTALRLVGVEASESTLAIQARTTKVSGTQEDLLGKAITEVYGVPCVVERVEDIEGLRDRLPCIALVRFALFVDHYIAVLEVHDDFLIVGDPLSGRERLSREDFLERWRKTCLVLKPDGDL